MPAREPIGVTVHLPTSKEGMERLRERLIEVNSDILAAALNAHRRTARGEGGLYPITRRAGPLGKGTKEARKRRTGERHRCTSLNISRPRR